MYLKQQKRKNGDIYLSILEKYYEPEVGARERTVERIGYVSELKDKHDDPIAYYTAYAKELTEEAKKKTRGAVTIDLTSKLEINTYDSKNVGYCILKLLYAELSLDNFWATKIHKTETRRHSELLFRFLIFNHILCPDYDDNPLSNRDFFFEPLDELSQIGINESLDIIDIYYKEFQTQIKNHLKGKYNIDIQAAIEDAKKMSKKMPAVYIAPRHNHAYYIICFASLILTALLHEKTGHRFDTAAIIEALRKYNCTHLETNRWQVTYYDEILDTLAKNMDIELDKKYMTREELQHLLRY